MGTWGSGIFEDDQAGDLLGDLICLLYNTVRIDMEAVGDPDSNHAARKVAPTIACLRALATSIPSCKYGLQRSEFEAWRDQWLAWYDATLLNEWRDPAKGEAYRHNVAEEFRLLIEALDECDADEWEEMREAKVEKFESNPFELG